MLLKSLTFAALGGILLLGPPRIDVRTSNLPAGAIAVAEVHYHTDHDEARVYGTAYGYVQGQRTERVVTLRKMDDHHYRVDNSWGNTAVALVLGVEQGEHGRHGAAEALLRVDRTGKVLAIDVARTNPIIGSAMPRRVNDREIEGALEQLGYRIGD
jgi:hypothetical protein